MRMPWSKSKAEQLEQLDPEVAALHADRRSPTPHERVAACATSKGTPPRAASGNDGRPKFVPLDRLDEEPNNPRKEFAEAQLAELAEDIRERGILEAIIVHPADAAGRYRIHFGA